jgi:hypothetical protein
MNKQVLQDEIIETVRNYWRLKAALAVYRETSDVQPLLSRSLTYTGLPSYGRINSYLNAEKLQESFSQLSSYVSNRLPQDTFLLQLSVLEQFLSNELSIRNLDSSGTLGRLQKTLEGSHQVNSKLPIVLQLDEVRARRNCLIHNHGKVNPEYKTAAISAYQYSNGNIDDPNLVQDLRISEKYLIYCGDTLINYGFLY